MRKLGTGETDWSGVNGEVTVGTDLIVPEHQPPSEVLARKWRSGVESGLLSLRDCARQLVSQRIVVGILVRKGKLAEERRRG